ncbi:MAG: hypothetical protein WD850_01795 [Candidatus Spechtbacterales bacterium]
MLNEPAVLKMPVGSSVTVRNADSASHAIHIGEISYEVGAASEQSISFDLPEGPGLYSYLCDDSQNVNGLIIATEG